MPELKCNPGCTFPVFVCLTRKYSRLAVGTRKCFDPQLNRNVKQIGATETAKAFKGFLFLCH